MVLLQFFEKQVFFYLLIGIFSLFNKFCHLFIQYIQFLVLPHILALSQYLFQALYPLLKVLVLRALLAIVGSDLLAHSLFHTIFDEDDDLLDDHLHYLFHADGDFVVDHLINVA